MTNALLEWHVHLLGYLNPTIFAIMVISAQLVQIIQIVGEPFPTGSLERGILQLLVLLESILSLQMSHRMGIVSIVHWEIIAFNQLVVRYENQCTVQWDTIVMASQSTLAELGIRMAKTLNQFIKAGFHMSVFISFSDWIKPPMNRHKFETPLKPTLHREMEIMAYLIMPSAYPTQRTILSRELNHGVILDQNNVYLVHGQIGRV